MYKRRRDLFFKTFPSSIVIISSGHKVNNLIGKNVVSSNFHYFTGLNEDNMIAVISNGKKGYKYNIFWKEPSQQEQIWDGPSIDSKQLLYQSKADNIYPLETLKTKLKELMDGVRNIYYSFGSHDIVDEIVLKTFSQLQGSYKEAKMYPEAIYELNRAMEDFRLEKDSYEIQQVKKAIKITEEAFSKALKGTKAGMFEYEVEGLMKYTYTCHGCAPSFPPIIASGNNATYLHYTKNNKKMLKNALILIDSGVRYKNYCSDITRTWPIKGTFTKAQREIYEAVLDTQKATISMMKPGASIASFHETTKIKLIEHMINLKILSGSVKKNIESKEYQKYYMHGAGHSLGLDVHDLGGVYNNLKPRIFKPGMIFTIEPGLYIHKDSKVPAKFKGIGVRIEDNILITKNGCEILSKNIPKEIKDLEHIIHV